MSQQGQVLFSFPFYDVPSNAQKHSLPPPRLTATGGQGALFAFLRASLRVSAFNKWTGCKGEGGVLRGERGVVELLL